MGEALDAASARRILEAPVAEDTGRVTVLLTPIRVSANGRLLLTTLANLTLAIQLENGDEASYAIITGRKTAGRCGASTCRLLQP